ncbi:MAG: quinone-dependent dihydroorotate dehydrogenase [Candidatus Latescibacterota bacterium]|nr:quinone-dependent dihydroorotate dehydrogenase [Candidatus Latescibacterota bacterium]
MDCYRHMVRPLLFRCDPEWVHERALSLGERVGASAAGRNLLKGLFAYEDARLATEVGGLRFANPLGMAAGFDKNGRVIQALAALGFGFVEVGSVSAHAAEGNPRPRLFRLPLDEAVVVNYGVPNDGAEVVAARVAERPMNAPLGINLVETNTGQPIEPDAVVAEFVEAVKPFTRRADYIALNLNCPNTTGGVSPFDGGSHLRDLMREYAAIDDLPPIFLKFTAHADPARMERMLEAIDSFDFVKGFVFNLPPGKDYPLKSPAPLVDPLPGTLCGKPVRAMIDETVRFWYGRIDRAQHKLIGVGGISSAEDAYRKIRLGASLVQLYSALVFKGPGIVREVNAGLARLLARDGFGHVAEAVGIDNEAQAVV